MLSKKMAVSLTSLITIFALAFMVPSTQAADEPFEIKIIGRSMISYTLAAEDDTATDPFNEATDIRVALEIESAQVLPNDYASKITFYVADKDGIPILKADADATPAVTGYTIRVADDPDYPNRTGKKRRIHVDITEMTSEATPRTVRTVVLSIAADAITTPDATVPTTDKKNMNKLVQHTLTLTKAATTAELAKLPKVVSIQRLRPGSQTVVAAFQEERLALDDFPTFDVRIVLTDVPHGIDLAAAGNLVEVQNGVPSNLIVGKTFTRFGGLWAVGDDHPTGGTLTADDTTDGVVDNDIIGTAKPDETVRPDPGEGHYYFDENYPPLQDTERISMNMADTVPLPTSHDGRNTMYRQYRVTITPDQKSSNFDVKIRVKSFHDNGSPIRNTYVVRNFDDSPHLPNGRDILTVPVAGAARDLTAGYKVTIPKEIRIPGGGYLVIAQNIGGSEVVVPPGSKKDAPKTTERTPAQRIYNVIEYADLPNLAEQFRNGVVVDVQSQHAGLVISEVMWGEDVSLATSSNSQYIELYNPGADYVTVDDADNTPDVNEALTLIFYGSNEFGDIPAAGADGSLPTGITDRIGTLDTTGDYWSPEGKGSSGRSGTTGGELREGRGEFVDAVPIVSMYRVMEADGTIDAMMGQMEAKWMSSQGPKTANFDPKAIGVRHGTPGAATDSTRTPADDTADAKAKADEEKAAADAKAKAAEKIRNTGTIPTAGRIYISEIMFAGGGVLPQWIEIANGSATEDVNLSGWTLKIDNAAADADVDIGASATFTIPNGTMIDRSRQTGATKTPSTILIVTEQGRNNIDAVSNQVINLKMDNDVELINAGVTKRKYTLLSGEAFLITLAPPEPAKSTPPAGETAAAKARRMADEKAEATIRKEATDMAGNLGADGTAAWTLPMSEDGRSSIIRSHVNVRIGPAEPEGETPKGSDGPLSATRMTDWVLAANTAFKDATHIRQKTYYGAMTDEGTPGFRAGGALPVELSHFSPARDKVTDAVVITWSTQSELNNAGFFIKRSQQRNGEFKVINATLIAGAGTTSEKQFYTYTDTTAQPNVVYYYQIEDVSLDGHRQTLTRGIRLKGHVGAAGKATTLWGELKTSHE